MEINVNEIKPSRHQARKDFDEESIKQLADSIDKEGLLQPITVRIVSEYGCTGVSASQQENEVTLTRPNAETPIQYELIAGERRLRAVKSLGRPTIEARVIEVVSEAAACSKGLVENLQRKDLNPIEEAEGFLELNQLDPNHWTHDEIAKVAGRSRVYVTQSLGFIKLPALIQDYVRRLTLNRSQILEVMRLPTGETQIQAAEKAKDFSWKDTRKLVDQMLGGGQKAAKSLPAGRQGEKPAAASSNQGFRFAKKGTNLAITAPFPEAANLDKFLADLREAFLAWSSKAE